MTTTLRALTNIGALCALLFVPSCAPDALTAEDLADSDEARVASSSYFRIRRDTRRCVSPLCGGAWVSRVNHATTRCVDGSYRSECYVAEVDWAALRLSERSLPPFQDLAYEGRAVLRGRVSPRSYDRFGTLGLFVVTEGWQSATSAPPTGTFYHATDNGRRCIAAPCFSLDLDRLNSGVDTTASSVDLRRIAGATQADIDKGYDYLGQPVGILVAGSLRAVPHAGPAGAGRSLTATQYYLRVSEGVADDRFCMSGDDCVGSNYDVAVTSRSECYCAGCWRYTALNRASADANHDQWRRYCTGVPVACLRVACRIPPTVSCVAHACTIGSAP